MNIFLRIVIVALAACLFFCDAASAKTDETIEIIATTNLLKAYPDIPQECQADLKENSSWTACKGVRNGWTRIGFGWGGWIPAVTLYASQDRYSIDRLDSGELRVEKRTAIQFEDPNWDVTVCWYFTLLFIAVAGLIAWNTRSLKGHLVVNGAIIISEIIFLGMATWLNDDYSDWFLAYGQSLTLCGFGMLWFSIVISKGDSSMGVAVLISGVLASMPVIYWASMVGWVGKSFADPGVRDGLFVTIILSMSIWVARALLIVLRGACKNYKRSHEST